MLKPDFNELKKRANGMLPPEVYGAIYETAQLVKSGDILEIGTAHGAATIALALGGQNSKIITVDKIRGGSRDAFGDLEANLHIIQDNFKNFGVENRVELHVATSIEFAADLPQKMNLALLMLDADGAIDRDFRLFYDALTPGGPVIIDDYQPNFVRVYNRSGDIRIDQKRRLTALLVDHFVANGYLEFSRLVGQTWFGFKPDRAPSMKDINNEEIYDLYRKLIFADGTLHGKAAEFLNNVTQKFPGLHRALKKTYLAFKK